MPKATVLYPALLVLSLATIPLTAEANAVRAINAARLHGCRPSTSSELRENSRLNEGARRLARGESLHEVPTKVGYRAMNAVALHITNVPTDVDIERFVARRFCTELSAPDLRDIGTYQSGPDLWLLVAAPFAPPSAADRRAVEQRVLELTNQARAQSRHCGSEAFPAVPPLVWGAPALERAAMEHSLDMAHHDYMDHTGRDGSTPGDRVTHAGYKWTAVGENLASGITSPEKVVNGWVASPHHCENLMDARFTEMAVAYAVKSSSSGGIYWTQLFGKPAPSGRR